MTTVTKTEFVKLNLYFLKLFHQILLKKFILKCMFMVALPPGGVAVLAAREGGLQVLAPSYSVGRILLGTPGGLASYIQTHSMK